MTHGSRSSISDDRAMVYASARFQRNFVFTEVEYDAIISFLKGLIKPSSKLCAKRLMIIFALL